MGIDRQIDILDILFLFNRWTKMINKYLSFWIFFLYFFDFMNLILIFSLFLWAKVCYFACLPVNVGNRGSVGVFLNCTQLSIITLHISHHKWYFYAE